MTDLDKFGYPEHLYRLSGYLSSLDDSVVQAAWVNRVQEILDGSFAQHSALVEHARTLERRAALYEKALRGIRKHRCSDGCDHVARAALAGEDA
jgi:hypothetical protein